MRKGLIGVIVFFSHQMPRVDNVPSQGSKSLWVLTQKEDLPGPPGYQVFSNSFFLLHN